MNGARLLYNQSSCWKASYKGAEWELSKPTDQKWGAPVSGEAAAYQKGEKECLSRRVTRAKL